MNRRLPGAHLYRRQQVVSCHLVTSAGCVRISRLGPKTIGGAARFGYHPSRRYLELAALPQSMTFSSTVSK